MRVNVEKRRFFRSDIFVYIMLAVQVALWTQTKKYQPDLAIVPDVPSTAAVKAISLGDEQFYFRTLTFQLQNAGDTFGRFTALKNYNYNKLYHWFTLLDTLDSKSNFVPSIAAYYFSQTQNVADTKYVAKYLEETSEKDLYNKWWWMSQAVYIANNKLQDKEWALRLAYKLAATPRNDIPLWAKQMPAFIHEQRGEDTQAMQIICSIIKNIDKLDQGELNFMTYFVLDRLNKRYSNLSQREQIGRLINDCPQFEEFYKNTLTENHKPNAANTDEKTPPSPDNE